MTEKQAPSNNDQNSAQPFQVISQYVRDLSFENPHVKDRILNLNPESNVDPDINIDLNTSAEKIQDNVYEVILDINVNAKMGDKQLFLGELSYGAMVNVAKDLPQDLLGPVLMVHLPYLMFPFAREVIASSVAAGGLPAFMLEPVDFAQIYHNQQQAEQNPEKTAAAANNLN